MEFVKLLAENAKTIINIQNVIPGFYLVTIFIHINKLHNKMHGALLVSGVVVVQQYV